MKDEVLQKWTEYAASFDVDKDYLTIYINIPFCLQKCSYCIHYEQKYENEEQVSNYIDLLEKQMIEYSSIFKDIKISAIYLGGGTASILSINQLGLLFDIIKSNFNIDYDENQFTLECHPITLTKEKIDFLYNSFITRITLGIQTFSPQLLEQEKRLHLSLEENVSMISYILDKFKDKNFMLNVDLMSGLKNQKPELLIEDFKLLSLIGVPKITIYPYRKNNEHNEENNTSLRKQREEFLVPLVEYVDKENKYDYEDLFSIGDNCENDSYYQFLLKGYEFNFNKIYNDKPGIIDGRINSNASMGDNTYNWIRLNYGYVFENYKYGKFPMFDEEQDSIQHNIFVYKVSGLRKKINS